MALIQIKVAVASNNGGCSSECSECSPVKGVVDRDKTVANDGILTGSIVPRAEDNVSKWVEGCQCYVNFEFDDVQLAPGVILLPCDVCLVCGCVIDLMARQSEVLTNYVDDAIEDTDVGSLETRITTAEGDITALEGRMTTAETDINTAEAALVTVNARVDAVERTYFPSGRVVGSPVDSLLSGLAIPLGLTTIKTANAAFVNTSSKPVWVKFTIEIPHFSWYLQSQFSANYDYNYTITNDAVVVDTLGSVPTAGVNNALGDSIYISQANGLAGVGTGSHKVLPGKTISMSVEMRLNAAGILHTDNQLRIRGLWINYDVSPADV